LGDKHIGAVNGSSFGDEHLMIGIQRVPNGSLISKVCLQIPLTLPFLSHVIVIALNGIGNC